jgi:peptidoglycan/xylan/chitin deacetylase (PgdA/CDA1 family)
MLCNLPSTLQFEKLQRLHEAIQDKFEMTPIAFRSGRWGFDAEVARNIVRLGYRIDTSDHTVYLVGTHVWAGLFVRLSSTLYVHGGVSH